MYAGLPFVKPLLGKDTERQCQSFLKILTLFKRVLKGRRPRKLSLGVSLLSDCSPG
jgi:hypothetical protein